VIKKWVERHWYDFEDPEMFENLKDFVNSITAAKLEGISIQINKTIERNVTIPFPAFFSSLSTLFFCPHLYPFSSSFSFFSFFFFFFFFPFFLFSFFPPPLFRKKQQPMQNLTNSLKINRSGG